MSAVAEVIDIESTPDDCAAWAATAPLTEGVLTPFGVLDPEKLSQDGCLDALVALERVKAWADAQQARVLAQAAAHPDPVPAPRGQREHYAQLSLQEEIGRALRWSSGVAADRIRTATTLVHRLPATLTQLEEGRLGYLHARSVSDAVADLDDTVARQVEARVLPRAAGQTLAELRRSLRRAVAAADPRGEDQKHRSEAADRRVCYQPAEHAMAWLNSYLPAEDAQTVLTAVQAVADRMTSQHPDTQHPGDGRTADQKRADALTGICAAVLNGTVLNGTVLNGLVITGLSELPRWQGRRPSVEVVVALSTLLGVDEQPGELSGYGPIPADLARRIAADDTGTWHRLITDETGTLIDYGRTVYRPPQDLRDFVIARDRTDRLPGSHRTARRCELDHVRAWAHGGHTNADNLMPESPRAHHLKHDAGWDVHRLPDGTTRWTSPTGRHYDKPPETYPVDRTRPKINPDDEPPPF